MNTKRELSFEEYADINDAAVELYFACKAAHKLLLTPTNERGSFDAVTMIHQLGEVIAKAEGYPKKPLRGAAA